MVYWEIAMVGISWPQHVQELNDSLSIVDIEVAVFYVIKYMIVFFRGELWNQADLI